MKVKIGKYPRWIGPYQIARMLMFWKDKEDDSVHAFGGWLAGEDKPTLLSRLCTWIDSKRKRTVKVQIDPWDSWSADHTMALIILPILKQLRESAHGAPFVDDEDVPKGMRSTDAKPKENPWEPDEHHFRRWDWVLGEMIAAFEIIVEDERIFWDVKTDERRDNGLKLFGKYYMALWD